MNPLRAALTAAVVIAVDQVAKALVRAHVALGSEDGILPGVQLVHSKNRGVAFNLLEGKTAVVGVITALVVLALLAFFVRHRDRPLLWLPVGLLLGGAAGNVIDRVVHGEVTDFIKLPAWPAFNVADVCITFGVLALFYVLEGRKREA